MQILIDDDLGRLTLRRLWPWHRLLARCLAPSLDRQLADGVPAGDERGPGRTGHGPDLGQVPPWPGREPAADAGGVHLPAQGVAMVSQLLADGGGPLYRAGGRDDLDSIIERAAQALAR